jgi:hypothetical protein
MVEPNAERRLHPGRIGCHVNRLQPLRDMRETGCFQRLTRRCQAFSGRPVIVRESNWREPAVVERRASARLLGDQMLERGRITRRQVYVEIGAFRRQCAANQRRRFRPRSRHNHTCERHQASHACTKSAAPAGGCKACHGHALGHPARDRIHFERGSQGIAGDWIDIKAGRRCGRARARGDPRQVSWHENYVP